MSSQQSTFKFAPERRIYTVAELSRAISKIFEEEFPDVWVSGEISGTKLSASQHYYFTLKDKDAQLQCVCFRGSWRYLKFRPQDGLAALARGRLEVYEPRGQYQLIVEALEPQGYGALQLAFEQLKKRLEEEGLFAAERKRALPRFPRRIGLISSPTGAVIRDILRVLERRFAGLHIRLYPSLVQGEGSADQVCAGLRYFSENPWADVVIVARGGGSLEDLWTFNEEPVARAIAACRAPVISAIGHETDFTIADFVADLRAPTPSAAAEMLIVGKSELLERLAANQKRLSQSIRLRLHELERRLVERGVERAQATLGRKIRRFQVRLDEADESLHSAVRRTIRNWDRRWKEADGRLSVLDFRVRLARTRGRLEAADTACGRAMRRLLEQRLARVDLLTGQVQQLSPLRVLERGYAIVEKTDGAVVREAAETRIGENLGVRLSRGRLRVTVLETLAAPTAPDGSSELPSQ